MAEKILSSRTVPTNNYPRPSVVLASITTLLKEVQESKFTVLPSLLLPRGVEDSCYFEIAGVTFRVLVVFDIGSTPPLFKGGWILLVDVLVDDGE